MAKLGVRGAEKTLQQRQNFLTPRMINKYLLNWAMNAAVLCILKETIFSRTASMALKWSFVSCSILIVQISPKT